MTFTVESIVADTHPPAYSIHKYWARKPHNVVRHVLGLLGAKSGRLFVDPFCGSGVPLSEAAILGMTCIGGDVNPIAAELSSLTLAPPSSVAVAIAFDRILAELRKKHWDRYIEAGMGRFFQSRRQEQG